MIKGDCRGQSLIELTVTLALITILAGLGGIGGAVLIKRHNERLCAQECEQVFAEIMILRSDAVMTGVRGNCVKGDTNMVIFERYNPQTKKKERSVIYLKHCRLGGSLAGGVQGKPWIFLLPWGTTSHAGTFDFIVGSRVVRRITFQPGAGRIYINESP